MAESGGGQAFRFGLAPDMEIDEEGGGGFVVPHKIPHEDVEDVVVERGQTASIRSLGSEYELVAVGVLEYGGGAPGFDFGSLGEFDA